MHNPAEATRLPAERKLFRHLGRMFLVVAEFPDTEAGTREANQFMESHPGVGVLAVEEGRVILANNDDEGATSDIDLIIQRMKLAAKADRWGRGGETVGLSLILVDASRSASFSWQISGKRVKLAEVRALLEEAAVRGELPIVATQKA